MNKIIITIFTSLLIFVSCQKKSNEPKKTPNKNNEKTFAQKVETAHEKNIFLRQEAIQFDVFIEFGGNEIFNANITISTTSDIAKITYKNGDEIFVEKILVLKIILVYFSLVIFLYEIGHIWRWANCQGESCLDEFEKFIGHAVSRVEGRGCAYVNPNVIIIDEWNDLSQCYRFD